MGLERDLRQKYEELCTEIGDRERALVEDVPGNSVFGLEETLQRTVRRWQNGTKSFRALPVAEAYEAYLNDDLSDGIKRALVGLDANINILDDIIDTTDLGTEEKVAMTANAAFSSVLAFGSIPHDHQQAMVEASYQYLTELFQIPHVEQYTHHQLEATEAPDEALDTIIDSYAYRARDINGFAHIPATQYNIPEADAARIQHDLKTYRAHQLVFKDLHDVERDLRDDDPTPITVALEHYDDPDAVVKLVETVYDDFQYSEEGEQTYGDRLIALENQPDTVLDAVKQGMEQVETY